MGRFLRVGSVAGATAVGLVLGGGAVWALSGGSAESDDPVRAVRSPCNLAPKELLDEVVPDAVVVSVSRLADPGSAWWTGADCAVAPKGASERALTLRLERSGPRSEDVEPGKKRKIVVRPGAEEARARFDDALSERSRPCALQVVPGLGDQAAACAGTDDDGGTPAYRLLVRRGDLLLNAVATARAAGRREPLRRLAVGVLEAAR
ncbi:MAG: hypothetical protein IRY90_03245 [Actinomadura rubrobrunea]|nr:hypothetical protein [Actinomadura rubrobrunea]